MAAQHWRVLTTSPSGLRTIQADHFASAEDAEEFIVSHRWLIALSPGETAELIQDFDARIYPVWRANRPGSLQDTDTKP